MAEQRRHHLQTYADLTKRFGVKKAARMVGASVASIWRWNHQFARHGLAGLQPKYSNCGARSPFAQIHFSAAVVHRLEALIAELGPRDAWKKFALDPACPPAVARFVQRTGKVPAAIAHVGRLTPVQVRALASADGRRLYVKAPARGIIRLNLHLPPKFNLVKIA